VKALTLALAALLALAAPVTATDTEADAIKAVSDAYFLEEADAETTLAALDALYTDTESQACKDYILLLFTGIALVEAGADFSPVNALGTDLGFTFLLANVESADYACRIAI
jgi:hypothetical protein